MAEPKKAVYKQLQEINKAEFDYEPLTNEDNTPYTEEELEILKTINKRHTYAGTTIPGFNKEDFTNELGETFSPINVNLEKERAQNQSAWAQAGAAINQAVLGQIVGGAMEGIGYLLDFEQTGNIIAGTEQEWGNWFSDLGKDLNTWTQEATPIYKNYNAGEFRPDKWSWWMSNAPSIASTLSLMIPATGAVKGISALGKALGLGSKLAESAKALRIAGKIEEAVALENKLKTASWMATGLGEAITSRHMENLMEASQTFKERYDAAIKAGKTDEEAKQNASIAASRSYGLNWVMLIQDIPEYLLLGGMKVPKGELSAAVEKAAGKLGLASKLAEARVRSVGNVLKTMASEGGEEAYQYIVSQEASRLSEMALVGKSDDGSKIGERFNNYIKDGELWTSAFFGAIGGATTQIVGAPIHKSILNQKGQLTFEQQQIKDLQKRGAKKQVLQDIYDSADAKGSEKGKERALDEITVETAMDAAIMGTTEKAIDFLNQLDISDEDKSSLTEKFTRVKDLYEKHAKNHPSVIAERLAHNDFLINILEKTRKETKAKQEDIAKNQVLADQLSSTGQAIQDLNVKSRAIKKNIATYKSILRKDETDSTEDHLTPKERKNANTQLKRNQTLLKNTEAKLKEAIDSYSDEETKAADKPILDSLDPTAAVEAKASHDFLMTNILQLQEENKRLQNPEEQEKILEELDKKIEKKQEDAKTEARKKRAEKHKERLNKIKDALNISKKEAEDKKSKAPSEREVEEIPEVEDVEAKAEAEARDKEFQAKRDDIENRRQEELTTKSGNRVSDKKAKKIEAKYDAELADLEAEYEDVPTKEELESDKLTDSFDHMFYGDEKEKLVSKEETIVINEVAEENADISDTKDSQTSYDYKRSEEGHNLMAYLSRLYTRIRSKESVSLQEITDDLNDNLHKDLLHPDKYLAGTEIALVLADYDDIEMIDPETGNKTTWGEYKINLGIKKTPKTLADIEALSTKERVEKYKEFGIIKKSDGTEITEKDINQNPTFYQNNTSQSNKDYVASEKTIRDLAERIAHRIGLDVRYENPQAINQGGNWIVKDFETNKILYNANSEKDAKNWLNENKNYKGKLEYNVAVINLAHATLDTPIHEILGHSIIRVLKNGEPGDYLFETEGGSKLYRNLLKELETGRGKEVLDRIKRDYIYKSNKVVEQNKKQLAKWKIDLEKNPNDKIAKDWINNLEKRIKKEEYTLEEQQEEAIVELLGLYTADRLDKVKDNKLISLLKKLLKEMKAYMKSLFKQKEVKVDELPDNMTLGDLADLLAYRDSKLILPGNEVVYITPDNQTFKTYQEASNHISELIKLAEIDLSTVNLTGQTIDKNNLPKDFKNIFTSARANVAFMIDGKYSDDYNNKQKELAKKYEGKFIVAKKDKWGVIPIEGENQTFYNTKAEAEEAALNKSIKVYNQNNSISGFISKNKQYEQAKKIIEEWIRVNNIKYDPEEVYSRGQGFYSVVGAYSNFEVELMFQNLLAHIEDNKKAGGEFIISAFTRPINTRLKHLEGDGGKIRFKIFPKSKHIRWAANTDVVSGSVWDASEKVSKDVKSELIGVSYTKAPSLYNIDAVQPNLAAIIDNLEHVHNELGIEITNDNFRLEYDADVPYSTKKLINKINDILDNKFGKLVEPKISNDSKQPTQTNDNLKKSIKDIKNTLTSTTVFDRFTYNNYFYSNLFDGTYVKMHTSKLQTSYAKDVIYITKEEFEEALIKKYPNKEYTSQAKINTRMAALKKGQRKFPRSLIRSEIRPIEVTNVKHNLFDADELPFQKVSKKELTPKQQLSNKLEAQQLAQNKEWTNQVPIQIKDNDGNVLGYLHTDSWINEDNVFGDITKDKESLNKVRKHVIENGEFKTTIDAKTFGYLASTSTNEKDSLTKRMPDENLVIGVGDGRNIRIGKDNVTLNIANRDSIKSGLTYIVPKLGVDEEGNDVYYALPVSRKTWFAGNDNETEAKKKQSVARLLRRIMEVYFRNQQSTEENPLLTEADKKLKQDIEDAYGYNIYSTDEKTGIQKVLNLYIHNYHTNNESVEKVAIDITAKTKRPPVLFAFNKTGKENIWQMEFYRFGVGFKYINSVNTKDQGKINDILDMFEGAIVPNLFANISADGLASNTPVYGLNEDGGLETIAEDYYSYTKEMSETRLLSFKMDDGSYAYTVQPKISINLEGILGEKENIGEKTSLEKKKRERDALKKLLEIQPNKNNQKILDQLEREIKELEKQEAPVTVEDLKEEEVKETKEITLIKDDYTDKMEDNEDEYEDDPFDDDSFDSLSEEQVRQIETSVQQLYIESIGLSKQTDIIDMLHRNTIAAIYEGKEVRPKEAYARYKEFITKLRDNRQKNHEELLANKEAVMKDPVLLKRARRNKAQLTTFENILANWDTITKLAEDKLRRATGIKVVKAKDDDRNDDELEKNDNWNGDQYISDLKDSASSEVKAFLSNITELDKDGNPEKNFLGEDKILSMDYVYNNLQSLITDLDADINVIIARLKKYEKTTKWIKEVREKLEKAPTRIKKLFVTDMTNHYNRMLYIEWEQQRNKSFVTKIREANSNSVKQRIMNDWRADQPKSRLIGTDGQGNHTYILPVKEEMAAMYESWKENNFKDVPEKEAKDWLSMFGITLSDKTWRAIKDGKYTHNGIAHGYYPDTATEGYIKPDIFSSSNGLFKVLYNKLASFKTIEANDALTQGVIVSLAELAAEYTPTVLSNSHRTGDKTVYSHGKNKYLVTRVRELKHLDENGTPTLVNKLKELPFSNSSLWLDKLSDPESSFTQNFRYWIAGLEAIKKAGSKTRSNASLDASSVADIEAFRIGQLQSKQSDKSGKNASLINLVYPTTSDKTNVFGLTVERADLKFTDEGNLTSESLELLYTQIVLPEINRILQYQKMQDSGVKSNIKGWEEGANRFLFLPELNDILMPEGYLTPNVQNPTVKKVIKAVINEYVITLTDEKLNTWANNGIGITDNEQRLSRLNLEYVDKLGAAKNGQRRAAATDMVSQYLIGNANVFMLFLTDPANYFKSKESDTTIAAMESFINIGKRLAGDVAPGTEADFGKEKTYTQLFLKDRVVDSLRIGELRERLGKKAADKNYTKMEGTDAQEVTTLKEHLRVMNSYGKIRTEGLYSKVAKIIDREIKKGNHQYMPEIKKELNEEELAEFNTLVFQPHKPVFNGNMIDNDTKIERRLYIKSSSLPLSPSVTAGFEIDKLRILMEKNGIDRAAYDTATKVGNVANSLDIWNEDGSINDQFDSDKIQEASLTLNRKDFRIQLEIPTKEVERIKKVSQATKNLLVDLLHVDGFMLRGKEYNGKDLRDLYNATVTSMYKSNYKKLIKHELKVEFDKHGNIVTLDINKLRDIIVNEAIDRGYNLAEIESLNLDTELTLLAFSGNSKKFQALLNSIIENRILKIKMPGKSYILASEEGFQNDGKINKDNDVKFTRNWTGKLLPQREVNGKILPAQILVSWNLRNNDGNLVDINKYLDADGYLDTSKIDPEILEGFTMRIPNQGPNLQSKVEIVGFLPPSAADVMIASRDYLAQMGSDFDIDKIYMYKKNYKQREDGTFGTEMFNSDDQNVKQYRENLLVNIHLAIHANPNEEVQKSIAEPLGFWKLQEAADKVDAARRNTAKFTGLSDEYQRTKFITGVAGKSGTAIFSVDSSFHAMVQGLDLEIGLGEDGFTIGRETSTGLFPADGIALDGKTLISDMIKGYQSAAVDNEKEQILSKLNVNATTFKVISILNELGFTSTPYFITQDIIIDYVNEIARLKDGRFFAGNTKKRAYENVIKKYKPEALEMTSDELKEHEENYESELTSEKMLEMIQIGTESTDYNSLQAAILSKFIRLEAFGQKLGTAQSLFNTDSAGMSKSILESVIKERSLENLETLGISNLPRIFEDKTIAGAATSYGLQTANRLWSKLFPFEQEGFKKLMDKAELVFNKSDGTVTSKATFWNEMWEAIQSYLYTDPTLGIVEGSVSENRENLFFGKDENFHNSLASLVRSAQTVLNNPFLNRLETKIFKNGKPNLIQFTASTKENSDEINLYTSFIDLIVNDRPLEYKKSFPEGYTTRQLAEDLIKYTYLSGGIQKAVEFVKLVPASYLYAIPFAKELSKVVTDNLFNQESFLGTDNSKNAVYYKLPQILVQYAQNNPHRLTQIESKDFIDLGGNRVMVTNKETYVARPGKKAFVPAEMLSIPVEDKVKGLKKFEVLIYTGESKNIKGERFPIYAKIDTLGIFGMPEFDRTSVGFLRSTIEGNRIKGGGEVIQKDSNLTEESDPAMKIKNPVADLMDGPVLTKYEVSKGDIVTTMNHILESKNPYHQLLAEELLRNISQIKNVRIEYDNNIPGEGRFKNGVIKLNKKYLKNATSEYFEIIFLHEIIHAFLVNKKASTPAGKKAWANLNKMFEEYKKSVSGAERDAYLKYLEDRKKGTTDPNWLNVAIEDRKELYSKYYATTDIQEFMAMAISDKGFQENLKAIPKLWKNFLKVVKQLLKALGVNVDTTLGVVINDVITLIQDPGSITLEGNTTSKDTLSSPEELRSAEQNNDSFDTLGEQDKWLKNYPTKKETLKKFNELNRDGTIKVMAEDRGGSSKNYNIMKNRAIKINQGQLVWKADIGRQRGESLGHTPGRIFYFIKLDLRPEMNNINYRKRAVTKEMIENMKSECK